MKKKYKIMYLPLFYEDLNSITDYIIHHFKNRTAAENLVDKLEKEICNRAFNPSSYEEYVSSRKRIDTYYRIYVENYTVFYTVKDDTMEVRRILYSRRNFDELI